MYSLWWVPEHILGYAIAALIAAVGVYVALMVKRARKPS
jgi:hypothetical protein